MKFKFLHVLFYIGVAVLFIGNLFCIQHWYLNSSYLIVLSGNGIEAVFSVLSLIEIISSKKASVSQKIFWTLVVLLTLGACFLRGLVPLLIVMVCGSRYLLRGRKAFLFNKNRKPYVEFDSI